MTRFEAEVVDVRLESHTGGRQRWRMLLTETEFSAAACAGTLEAVARSGARLQVAVLGVVVEGGEVWHVVEKPLGEGTAVTGMVAADAARDG